MGSHTVTCHLVEVTSSSLPQTAKAGTQFSHHEIITDKFISSSYSAELLKTTTRFLQAKCPSCRPTNSVKALKAKSGGVLAWLSVWGKAQICAWPS